MGIIGVGSLTKQDNSSSLFLCQLGMEDEDVIEVYQEQTGGLWND